MLKKRIALWIGLALVLLCASALADAVIDEATFPDPVFRKAVRAFDLNRDQYLDRREIYQAKSLNVSNLGIKDLKGIEYLVALENLDCFGNGLTSLDVSRNTALISLDCSKNQLKTLDLSLNLALTHVYCHTNQLTSLRLGKNTALRILVCDMNKLTSLDLSSCAALEELRCTYNQLNGLNLAGKKNLKSLDSFGNEMTTLDLKGCSSLISVTCSDNLLTSLDVRDCAMLKLLGCDYNRMTSLELGKHPLLDTIYCYGNAFTQLDVRGCPVLCGYMKQYQRELAYNSYDRFGEKFCFDCNVTVIGDYSSAPIGNGLAINAVNFPDSAFRAVVETFDQDKDHYLSAAEIAAVKEINCIKRGIVSLKGIEHFTALERLLCSQNQGLASPDLSKNTALFQLDIDNCQIKTLDVTRISKLTVLNCFSCGLTSLNVTQNPRLERLDCWNNKIAALDLSKNTKLTFLGVSSNPIRSLDLSRNTELKSLYCYDCPLPNLNLRKCSKLEILSCWNNSFSTLDVSGCPELCSAMNNFKRTYQEDTGHDHFGLFFEVDPSYTLIGDYESVHGKEPTRLTAQDGLYSLSRSGAALLKPVKSSVTALVVSDRVKANGKTYNVIGISDKACKGLSKLKEVTLGKYVKAIGKNAFASCKVLKTVKGGAAVMIIGDSAFSNCAKLENFPALKKLQQIGNSAFLNCTSLDKFLLDTAVKSIGKSAFQGCKALKAVTIKTTKLTLKNVGKKAFYGIYKKAVFKCPKKKVKDYELLLRACGAPPTAIFK